MHAQQGARTVLAVAVVAAFAVHARSAFASAPTERDAWPSSAAPTPKFAPETLYSNNASSVDWEPNVACGPSGAVIMTTTRYGNAAFPWRACPSCPDPDIIYRRGNLSSSARPAASAHAAATEPRHAAEITWSEDQFVCDCPGVGAQNDPVFVFAGPDHPNTVAAAWMDDWNISVAMSHDGGASFAEPVRVVSGASGLSFGDKPWLAISRDAQHVYITFNSEAPYAAVSSDGGATFGEPVQIFGAATSRYFFAGGIAVAPLSGVVATSQVGYQHTSLKGNINVYAMHSSDNGKTWQRSIVAQSQQGPPCPEWAGCEEDESFLGPSAAIAAGADDTLYMLFTRNHAANMPTEVQFSRSTDLGITWSAPVNVSIVTDDVIHAFPIIAAHPTVPGDVRVAWFDDRAGRDSTDPDMTRFAWNVFYRASVDGGASWGPEVRLSNAAAWPDGVTYKKPSGFGFPYGDYGGMCVTYDGRSVAAWGESAAFTANGGTWWTHEV